MRRRLSIGAANVLAAIAVVGSGGPAIAHPEGTTVISVQGGTGALALSRTTVHAGRTTFEVSATTGRTGPLMFTPAPGVSVDQVLADGREESSDDPATAATGTRDLTRDATFYGLADVAQYAPLSVTERLPAGTYYLVDLEAPAGSPPLRVRGRAHDREEASHDDVPTVLMNSADRFVSPSVLPARGDIQVRNVSNTLHFLSLAPVNPGTTDADVQAFFDGSTDTPALRRRARGRAERALPRKAGAVELEPASRDLRHAVLHRRRRDRHPTRLHGDAQGRRLEVSRPPGRIASRSRTQRSIAAYARAELPQRQYLPEPRSRG